MNTKIYLPTASKILELSGVTKSFEKPQDPEFLEIKSRLSEEEILIVGEEVLDSFITNQLLFQSSEDIKNLGEILGCRETYSNNKGIPKSINFRRK